MIEPGKRFRCRARDWNAMVKASNSSPVDQRITQEYSTGVSVRFRNDGELIRAYEPVVLGDPIQTPSESVTDIIFSGKSPEEVEQELYEYEDIDGLRETNIQENVYSFQSYRFLRVGITVADIEPGRFGVAIVSGVCRAWVKPVNIDDYEPDALVRQKTLIITGDPTIYNTPIAQGRPYRPHYGVRSLCNYLTAWNDGVWHLYTEDITTDGGSIWTYEVYPQYFTPTIPIVELLYYTKIELPERQDQRLAVVRFRDNLIQDGYENRTWEYPL